MKKIYTPIDMNRNEIRLLCLENRDTPPTPAVSGLAYFDTITETPMVYSNGAWVSMSGNKPGNVSETDFFLANSIGDKVIFEIGPSDGTGVVTVKTVSGTYDVTLVKNNLNADAVPDSYVNAGSDQGYSAGSVWVYGSRIFIAANGEGLFWREITGVKSWSGDYYDQDFSGSDLIIPHDLGSFQPIVQVYKRNVDLSYSQAIPGEILIIDENTIQISMNPVVPIRVTIVAR